MARAEFRCKACGKPAAVVELIEADTPRGKQLRLCQYGFIGEGWEEARPTDRPRLEAALTAGDAGALNTCGPRAAPFYCPECGACYCAEHWAVTPQFDDDMPGFYDCSYGTCPAGHRRMVED